MDSTTWCEIGVDHPAHRIETAYLDPQPQTPAPFSHDPVQKMLQRAAFMQSDVFILERLGKRNVTGARKRMFECSCQHQPVGRKIDDFHPIASRIRLPMSSTDFPGPCTTVVIA
jgi:hypothetical protein